MIPFYDANDALCNSLEHQNCIIHSNSSKNLVKIDSVYAGLPKNTFYSKKFRVLVPQIAPWNFCIFGPKQNVFADSTLNFDPIFKCHTILESWRVNFYDNVRKFLIALLTNEKSAK